MDTELEFTLLEELREQFGLSSSFSVNEGGLGVINMNENDSLASLIYTARFAKSQDKGALKSDDCVLYAHSQHQAPIFAAS